MGEPTATPTANKRGWESGSTTSTVAPDVLQRYVNGTATEEDLIALVQADAITVTQAREYTAAGPAVKTYPRGPENRARDIYPQARGPMADAFAALDAYGIEPPPISSIDEPVRRIRAGVHSPADINQLAELGLLTAGQAQDLLFGDGGGFGGGGITAYQAAQLAREDEALKYQKEQDRVGNAIAEIRTMQDSAALEDRRRQSAQGDRLAGLEWAIGPDVTHFSGFGPSSAGVELGLADAVPVTPMAFDPNAALRPGAYDRAMQQQIEDLRMMLG